MPVILWTDALIFFLSLLAFVAAIIGWRNKNIRAAWRNVYTTPSRMIALVVLLLFVCIGLLDSMHFMAKTSVGSEATSLQSVLDVMLRPISQQMEASYSAPFATHLLDKDMVTDEHGGVKWVSTKLQYVTPVPILGCVLQGLVTGLFIWLALTAVLWLRRIKFRNIAVGWITFAVILILIGICHELMQHYHIFGTDKIGQDVFYSSLKSIRTGLVIGTLTTILTLPFAILFGAMAGYYSGWIDDVIQYIYTTLSSIPGVLLIAAAMLSLDAVISRHSDVFTLMAQRSDARLLLLCAIMGITSWTSLCRILRGETLKLRDQAFILSSKVMGLSNMQIIIKHIVPNLFHIILISLILDFSGLVLAEAVLSYVGVGVDAAMFSWGNMINGARMEMGRDPVIWWSLAGAFILMFMLVLSANIFADGVREAFDPRAKV